MKEDQTMNLDIIGGATGILSGLIATVINTGAASTVSIILTVVCTCISGLGIGVRIYDAVKRYSQGKTDAKTAAKELDQIADELKTRGGLGDDK